MVELVIFWMVTSCLLAGSTFVFSLTTWRYYSRHKQSELNVIAGREAYESLKGSKDMLEKLVGKKNIEVNALKIEIDANIEQLGRERENHTVKDDQMKRIKEILEEGDEEC